MRNRRVIAIDLGSAFTKIALRSDWERPTQLLHDIPMASTLETFCVPSVVANVAGTWLVGRAAADQLPGPHVHIYRNWKARIFPDLDDARRRDANGPKVPAAPSAHTPAELATAFLQGIRRLFEQDLRLKPYLDLPTRACIPSLGNAEFGEALARDLLGRSGWNCSVGRTALAEPESNAIGLITRGRNATWFPSHVPYQRFNGRSVYLPRMIGRPLSDMLRAMTGAYGLLVTDVGAFTTDFGHVLFDATYSTDTWNRPQVTHRSRKLGVRDLDRRVYKALSEPVQEAIAAAPGIWEHRKRTLYSGEPVAVRNPAGGTFVIGEGAQGREIAGLVKNFAEEIWEAREAFLRDTGVKPTQGEALTGGGVLIPAVRATLVDRLREANTRWIYDLQDAAEVRRQHTDINGYADERTIERQLIVNREHLRGGSAIGACSVFVEA